MKEIIIIECVIHSGIEPRIRKGPSPNQLEAARNHAMKRIRDSAIKHGIIDKTKENARTVLCEFIAGLGFEADISFDENAYDLRPPRRDDR